MKTSDTIVFLLRIVKILSKKLKVRKHT